MKMFVAVAVGLILVVAVVLGVAAQDGALASLAQPLVVNIEQAVPVDVTVAVDMGDGEVVEVTTPITVGVAMQVRIDGAGVVAVTAGAAQAPVVEVTREEAAGGALVDSEDRTYEIEAPDDIAVTNVASSVNALDRLEIIGEIRNDGAGPLRLVQVIATLYDQDGAMLSVDTSFASIKEIAPGQTSPFQVMSAASGADVVSYRLQIQP